MDFSEMEYYKAEQQTIIAIVSGKNVSTNPTSIVAIGQPGAGKTGLTRYLTLNFMQETNEDIVHIDPDLVGQFHPRYKEILSSKGLESFQHLAKFSSRALKTINAYCMERKFNLMTEGTFRDTEGYMRIFREMKEKGYKIDLNLLAVHRIESLISSMERYFYMINHRIPIRIVSVKPHDEAYENMSKTLKQVEKEGLATRIRVFNRGEDELIPNLVYSSDKPNGRYQTPFEALNGERNRNIESMIQEEQKVKRRLENLKQEASLHGSEEEIFKQILAIEKMYEEEVSKRKCPIDREK